MTAKVRRPRHAERSSEGLRGAKLHREMRERAFQRWWKRFNAGGSYSAAEQEWRSCFVAGWNSGRSHQRRLDCEYPEDKEP